MKKNHMLLILILVLFLVIGSAYALYDRFGKDFAPEQLGEQDAELAKDFTVADTQGNPIQLSDFIGKPIVLNFWASWCGPCKSEMPDFEEAHRELGSEVQFLMINVTDGYQETVKTASAFIAQQGYTFPVYFDIMYDASNAYNVNSLPTTFFIDAQGHVAAKSVGAISAATLQQGIDMIYSGS